MATKLLILLGTKKGLFILESDAARRDWAQRGPYCEAWPICHAIADPRTGTIHAGGGNEWFGPAVWTSADLVCWSAMSARPLTHSALGHLTLQEFAARMAWKGGS